MNNRLSVLLIAMLLVQACKANCAERQQLEVNCGNYCYKVVVPLLDHLKALQSQVNDSKSQSESLANVESSMKLIAEILNGHNTKIEQKLEDLRRMIDIALLKQIENNLSRFQNIERQLEKIDVPDRKLTQNLENPTKLIENSECPNIEQLLKEKFEMLDKKLDKQLQQRIDLLAKNMDKQFENISNRTEIVLQKQVAVSSENCQNFMHFKNNFRPNSDFTTKFESLQAFVQQKFEIFQKQLNEKFSTQSKVIETSLQKQLDYFQVKFASLAKSEHIQSIQDKLQTLQKKSDTQMPNTLTQFENIKNQLNGQINMHDKKMENKLFDMNKLIEVRKLRVGKPFKKFGLKYYYIESNEKVNWFVAVHRCLQFGGHLASIQHLSELTALKANISTHGDYWVDINDLGTEGVYMSATTGLTANYLNWHKGEPNNVKKNEHCVCLWFRNNIYQMNDDNCQAAKRFICETENV